MYIGLWSRVDGLARETLTRALERRTVVRGTLLRATIHLVSARDYWPFAIAVENRRREWWTSVQRDSPSPRDMAAAARRLRAGLADGALRRAEIEDLLGRERARGVGMWIHLVRVPPSGTWERRRADLYGDAEEWLGPPDVTPADALEHLVRPYLGAFGPASRADLVSWAGLPPTAVAPVLVRMPFAAVSLRNGRGAPGSPPRAAPRPEDARSRPLPADLGRNPPRPRPAPGILPEEYRPLIFDTKTPQSVGTFLVDGSVAGTWRYEGGGIRLEPFRRIDRATRRELDEEAERLAAFHA